QEGQAAEGGQTAAAQLRVGGVADVVEQEAEGGVAGGERGDLPDDRVQQVLEPSRVTEAAFAVMEDHGDDGWQGARGRGFSLATRITSSTVATWGRSRLSPHERSRPPRRGEARSATTPRY